MLSTENELIDGATQPAMTLGSIGADEGMKQLIQSGLFAFKAAV